MSNCCTLRPVPPPTKVPIGLAIARAAKLLRRGFDQALAEAGGTLPLWQVVLALKAGAALTQRQLAEHLQLREPTVTHHLRAMEDAGLVARSRDPGNRRVQRVELTAAGEAAFQRWRSAAAAFDRRLRTGLADAQVDALRELLEAVAQNAEPR
jgi:MarR family transcriptional regulator for hemolysin